ncbi:hypothetical protein cypCar_00015169 [Cyprinus carpio]|nr:hypothetical protein cypCar_00015169 [Cyprinus carpio]
MNFYSDMVAKKLGRTTYRDLSELNLQSNSVRMVDLAPADLFSNLRNINLEHNNLTSFSDLIFLPNIKIFICLGQNDGRSCSCDLFSNLRNINLEHNNLTSFAISSFLPNIKIYYMFRTECQSHLCMSFLCMAMFTLI